MSRLFGQMTFFISATTSRMKRRGTVRNRMLPLEFEGPPPPTSEMYWRGPVLTDFDGREWRTLPREGTA